MNPALVPCTSSHLAYLVQTLRQQSQSPKAGRVTLAPISSKNCKTVLSDTIQAALSKAATDAAEGDRHG